MLKKFTSLCVKVVNRWLPDPFLFAVMLTILVFIAAWLGTGQSPMDIVVAWGSPTSGFWGLLTFAMQMALVLVLGSAMASAKIFKKFVGSVAALARDKRSAIMVTTFVSLICCWINWGFGLIAGALIAKEVARRVRDVDYRLLIASAYSGFVIWHVGLSGSIPLTLAGGSVVNDITYTISTADTIFHPMNLIMCASILIALPIINYAMHPVASETIVVDPKLLVAEKEVEYEVSTPAQKMEHSRILWVVVLVLGFAYIGQYFVKLVAAQGIAGIPAGLNLNIVNMIFLFLGILMHGNLRHYVDAIGKAAASSAGILLQFPFYAGIMGIMSATNPETGISIAQIISNFFINISNPTTFPVLSFISAGIINVFVPSGGGQWAVNGPIALTTAASMDIDAGIAAMTVAWGDQWTNMIQPFWALPALGIAGLSAKDIMGYLVIVLIVVGIIASGGFLLWPILF